MKPGRAADDVLVSHMLECIDRIRDYSRNDRSAFFASKLIQDAVARNLQTFAESSQRLSETLKTREPSIPWRDIAGFRNVLVHGYLGLDLEIVWRIVEIDLPVLRDALLRLRRWLDSAGDTDG
jgi:uncharacterized protein with HEPN domain